MKTATKSILILDDEKPVIQALEKILEESFRVTTATTNQEVKSKIAFEDFDIFIADYHLANQQNSQKVIMEIYEKNLISDHKTHIILFSGAVEQEIVVKLKSIVSAILVKPIDADMLLRTINRLLR